MIELAQVTKEGVAIFVTSAASIAPLAGIVLAAERYGDRRVEKKKFKSIVSQIDQPPIHATLFTRRRRLKK